MKDIQQNQIGFKNNKKKQGCMDDEILQLMEKIKQQHKVQRDAKHHWKQMQRDKGEMVDKGMQRNYQKIQKHKSNPLKKVKEVAG